MNVLGIIPARGGSKGLPGKNFRNLLGKPVICYTIEAALAAGRLTRVIVSSDEPQAGEICRRYGIERLARPAELATDTARVDDVMRQCCRELERREGYRPDLVVLLYANIPVRAEGIIDKAIEHLVQTGADSVQTFARLGKLKHHPFWLYKLNGDRAEKFTHNDIYRRQELPPVYSIDAAAGVVTYQSLMNSEGRDNPHAFWGDDRRGIVQEEGETVDIDTMDDLRRAETLLQNKYRKAFSGRPPRAGWQDEKRRLYIIAEAGVNHNGSVEMAREMVRAAQEAGADCVKFQAFRAEELVTKEAAKADYQQHCGNEGETQYEMLKRCELGEGDFRVLKNDCDNLGIDFLVTPFSPHWVKVFAAMGVDSFKIGSGNLGAVNLLAAIGQTHLPVILSTGMSSLEEVDRSLNRLREAGCGEAALLQCVSLYPTRLDQVNLQAIQTLRSHTGCITGFSDHTLDVITGALAAAAGAEILEKHFTLDKKLEGPDQTMSLTPAEFKEYVTLARQAWAARGRGEKTVLPEEKPIQAAARMSVVAKRSISRGTVLTAEMLTCKRPGTGIPSEQIQEVIGKRAATDMEADQVIQWRNLE